MKRMCFVFIGIVALSSVAISAPVSAQTKDEIRALAISSLKVSNSMRSLAKAYKSLTQIVDHNIIKKLLPHEVSLILQSMPATEMALLNDAKAMELLAIKLRQYADNMR